MCNPPWTLLGALLMSPQHGQALAKALSHSCGAALVTSPLSAIGYLRAVEKYDKSIAKSVQEIGVVVAAASKSAADDDMENDIDDQKAGAKVEPTTRYLYIAFGGMAVPSPTAGGQRAVIVRIIFNSSDPKLLGVVVARAKNAPAINAHRAGRPGAAGRANILRNDMRAVTLVMKALVTTTRENSGDDLSPP